MNVLVLNAGSSSLKFQIIATDIERIKQGKDDRLCRGEIEGIGGEAAVKIQYGNDAPKIFSEPLRDIGTALEYLVKHITGTQPGISGMRSAADVDAIGHRVVHGGELFKESVLVDDRVLKGIADCADLAPLHNPDNLKGILAAGKLFGGDIPQVAVFDTAFHQSLSEQAYIYAIPYSLYEKYRIRRYGFHGTSHRYVAARYRALRGLTREQTNIITLHLGNGCSSAAIRNGHSIDTSMGMTPLEGLVMGTRSGDLDPAIVGFIARKEGMLPAEVDKLLNAKSGLLGISELTSDMRELQKSVAGGDRKADLAIEIFCYR
ncbi:MAG: acetate/propionate family kinase, partial [Candidatus Sulfotelmatobacter sp.]